MTNSAYSFSAVRQLLPGLTWARFERLRFLEERIGWHGAMSRDQLVDRFNVTPGIVSKDLADYDRLCRHAGVNNLAYDRVRKRFVRDRDFLPILTEESPETYLDRNLDSAAEGRLEDIPLPGRTIIPAVLRAILPALEGKATIVFDYVSENGEIARRSVLPRRLVRFMGRWHLRGWCLGRQDWRDFVLGRIDQIDADGEIIQEEPADPEWDNFAHVVLTANPGLPDARRRVIEIDYRMSDGALYLRTRRALVFYYRALYRQSPGQPPEQVPVVVREVREA